MKKILTLILALALAISCLGVAACKTEHECVWSSEYECSSTEHWKGCTVSGCDKTTERDSHDGNGAFKYNVVNDQTIEIGVSCTVCGKVAGQTAETVTVDKIITTQTNIYSSSFTCESGNVVLIKSGNYTSLSLNEKFSGVRIIGESDVVIKSISINVPLTIENVKIIGEGENLSIDEGVVIGADVENVTVKNCVFTDYANLSASTNKPTNLVVDGCTFTDFEKDDQTAIRLLYYNGLTVKNCIFNQVKYNALQIGSYYNGGAVTITGNKFLRVESRIIYLVYADNLTSCNISGNLFMDHHDNYIATESGVYPTKKDSGVYIHTKSTTASITVGINTWANIPEADAKYIAPVATYDPSQQNQYVAD